MMSKNVALLSIGTALLWSWLLFDVGHAAQIDRKQAAPNLMAAGTSRAAHSPTIQVSSTPTPCTEDGMRRPEAPCPKDNVQGSGRKALDKILYTIAGITATLVVTLIAMILWVLLARRIPLPPFVKGTH
jgi:ammonia channel protein AmtB